MRPGPIRAVFQGGPLNGTERILDHYLSEYRVAVATRIHVTAVGGSSPPVTIDVHKGVYRPTSDRTFPWEVTYRFEGLECPHE